MTPLILSTKLGLKMLSTGGMCLHMVCVHNFSETMQRLIPIFTGILTLALFGGIFLLFWSENRTYWAAFFGGLTGLRFIVLIRQSIRILGPQDEFED